MKKANYYFTLCLVLFTTLFSFFNMFQIVKVSSQVIQIVLTNLLPSLLPFMILISLCLSLGIFQLISYFIQFLFSPLFHLTPTYVFSLFCFLFLWLSNQCKNVKRILWIRLYYYFPTTTSSLHSILFIIKLYLCFPKTAFFSCTDDLYKSYSSKYNQSCLLSSRLPMDVFSWKYSADHSSPDAICRSPKKKYYIFFNSLYIYFRLYACLSIYWL